MKRAQAQERKWAGMNWIRQEKRLAIYLRDGLACAYCAHSIEDGAQLTLDHIRSYSHGGKNGESNLVTSCARCNKSRGNRALASFCVAVATYLNHDVTAEEIEQHVRNTSRRALPLDEAKTLIARRGSAARVLAEMNKESRKTRLMSRKGKYENTRLENSN